MERELPADVAEHLKELVESSNEEWSRSGDALDRLTDLWLEKDRLVVDQARLLGMDLVDQVPAEDRRGVLVTTYSGSLVALGPGAARSFEYASIKMRSDVPDLIRRDSVKVDGEIRTSRAVAFVGAPVKHTSAVHRIAVFPPGLGDEDQEQRIREAMIFLTNSFVHLNRHFTRPGDEMPGQFDKKSLIRYLADGNDLTQKQVRRLLEDYAVLLETGMLLGHTVPLGSLGRLSLSKKPPRKARVSRHPATGEEMTIPARDAYMAPVFKFSSRAKERAGDLPIDSVL